MVVASPFPKKISLLGGSTTLSSGSRAHEPTINFPLELENETRNLHARKHVQAKCELTSKDLRIRNRRRNPKVARLKAETGCDMRHIIYLTIKRMYGGKKCQMRISLNRLVRETPNNRTESGLKVLLNSVLEALGNNGQQTAV